MLKKSIRPIRNFAENSDLPTDLLKNVLLVKKTPKYERLKNSKFIEHPYIQDVLIHNWIEANNVHFDISERFEKVTRSMVDKL